MCFLLFLCFCTCSCCISCFMHFIPIYVVFIVQNYNNLFSVCCTNHSQSLSCGSAAGVTEFCVCLVLNADSSVSGWMEVSV